MDPRLAFGKAMKNGYVPPVRLTRLSAAAWSVVIPPNDKAMKEAQSRPKLSKARPEKQTEPKPKSLKAKSKPATKTPFVSQEENGEEDILEVTVSDNEFEIEQRTNPPILERLSDSTIALLNSELEENSDIDGPTWRYEDPEEIDLDPNFVTLPTSWWREKFLTLWEQDMFMDEIVDTVYLERKAICPEEKRGRFFYRQVALELKNMVEDEDSPLAWRHCVYDFCHYLMDLSLNARKNQQSLPPASSPSEYSFEVPSPLIYDEGIKQLDGSSKELEEDLMSEHEDEDHGIWKDPESIFGKTGTVAMGKEEDQLLKDMSFFASLGLQPKPDRLPQLPNSEITELTSFNFLDQTILDDEKTKEEEEGIPTKRAKLDVTHIPLVEISESDDDEKTWVIDFEAYL